MILTAVALGIDLLLIVSELITLAFTRSDDALVLVQAMIKSPLFWVEMVTAILAILFLLTAAARTPQGIAAASLLALVDLAVKRYLFVQMGFVEPNVKYPGAVTFTGAQAYYLPSFIEWGLIIGLIGLFALLFSMGLRILRLDSLRGSL
jgi:Ni/Fe-hydrogenase subunit HybB-like protein